MPEPSPEFLALLEQLRAERDAANDATARTSDQHRAQWLGIIERTLASKRTPDEQGAPYGDALLELTEDDLRLILGRLPWVRETHMGTVLSVNRTTKTCRVRIGPDALNPSVVPWQRPISYGLTPPTVGKTYPVHFPVVLPRTPQTLTAGPQTDPEHLPWLKVPGGKTGWLYYERWTDAFAAGALWRIEWPLEDDDTPASGELVQDLGAIGGWTGFPGLGFNTGLVGYNVGARALVAFNVEGSSHTDARKILLLDDWGFGTATVRTVPVEWVWSTVSDTTATDINTIPILGYALNTVEVDSGTAFPPTVPYSSTLTLRDSLDGGTTWRDITTYPYQRSDALLDPFSGLPIVPHIFALRTLLEPSGQTIAIAKAPGCEALADVGPLPAGTRLRPFLLVRLTSDELTFAAWPSVSLTIAAYLPDTAAVVELATIAPAEAFPALASRNNQLALPVNAHIRQQDDGTWVVYLALALSAPTDQSPFFNPSVRYALFRGQGPLDALTWVERGTAFDWNATDGIHQPTTYPEWTAPTDPCLPLVTSEDGLSIVTWSVGYDFANFPDHKLLYSLDAGETWALLPAGWQTSSGNGTPFNRPCALVTIPQDDPRAVPVEA